MRFTITPRDESKPGREACDAETLNPTIQRIAGRNPLSYPSVATSLRRRGRIFIALDRNADRDQWGDGIRVTDTWHVDHRPECDSAGDNA